MHPAYLKHIPRTIPPENTPISAFPIVSGHHARERPIPHRDNRCIVHFSDLPNSTAFFRLPTSSTSHLSIFTLMIRCKQNYFSSPRQNLSPSGFLVFSSRSPRLRYTDSVLMSCSFIYCRKSGNQMEGDAAATPAKASV